MSLSPQQHEKHPIGPTIGTIIVVVLLVCGALYFLVAKLVNRETPAPAPYIPNGTTTITVTH